MTERMVINRAKKLQELEQQKQEPEQQIDTLKDQIKKDMEQKGLEEMTASVHTTDRDSPHIEEKEKESP